MFLLATLSALAADPTLDVRLPSEPWAVTVSSDGTEVLSALRSEQLWQASEGTDFETLCGHGLDDSPTARTVGETLVIHCAESAYGEVTGSVVVSGGRAPWSNPRTLVGQPAGRAAAADGSVLLDRWGAKVWTRDPSGALIALTVSPKGPGALMRAEGDKVMLEALSPTGETTWTATLPVTLSDGDAWTSGPAVPKNLYATLLASDSGVVVLWNDFEMGGTPWAKLLSYSSQGELRWSADVPHHTPAALASTPQALLLAVPGGLHVLDPSTGKAAQHPLTGRHPRFSASGKHLLFDTEETLKVLSVGDPRHPERWTTQVEVPRSNATFAWLQDDVLVVTEGDRLRSWALLPPSVVDYDAFVTHERYRRFGDNAVAVLGLSEDGTLLALKIHDHTPTGSPLPRLVLYDLSTQALLPQSTVSFPPHYDGPDLDSGMSEALARSIQPVYAPALAVLAQRKVRPVRVTQQATVEGRAERTAADAFSLTLAGHGPLVVSSADAAWIPAETGSALTLTLEGGQTVTLWMDQDGSQVRPVAGTAAKAVK